MTELLTTSDAAFSKIAGYSLSTYEKEEDDIDGPFSVALSVEANSGGKIVWFASSSFLEDMYNAYSSGANGDMGHERVVTSGRRERSHGDSKQVAELQLSDDQRVHVLFAEGDDDRRVPAFVSGNRHLRGTDKEEKTE